VLKAKNLLSSLNPSQHVQNLRCNSIEVDVSLLASDIKIRTNDILKGSGNLNKMKAASHPGSAIEWPFCDIFLYWSQQTRPQDEQQQILADCARMRCKSTGLLSAMKPARPPCVST
jgi:hypothetical protein